MSSRADAPVGSDVRLVFPGAAAAERRVGGVALVAHATAQLYRRGARQIWIDLQDGGRLSPVAADDVRRAGDDASIHFVLDHEARRLKAAEIAPITIADVVEATGKPSDGLASRWVNRPVSRRISAQLLRISGLRPWHATAAVGLVGVVMILSLLFGGYAGLVAGGLLFQTASVLDGVDGEVARATYRSSARGALLDTSVDMAINVGFFVAVTISLTQLYGQSQALAGGIAIMLVVTGLSLMAWLARRLGKPGDLNFLKRFYRQRFPRGFAASITSALVAVTSRDLFALIFALTILAGGGRFILFALCGFAMLWLFLVLCAVRPILRGSAGAETIAGALAVDDTTRLA
ncbi:CDP-alcohol phosphatidyltransferase family protein [Sphingomonas sp. ERG5]|uniref:CDP-alcohol phosphatidyltransferase family protein n=1 Tax=Sphingomonas sp. ERG5 TaxID=1381597 RepID=UPI001269915C|nr:CDP-alcohol phosphatidyltransferase family protein [Sphingomonas sp. ERG5]